MPTEAKKEAGTMLATIALAHPLADEEDLRITPKDARIYAKRVIIRSMKKEKTKKW